MTNALTIWAIRHSLNTNIMIMKSYIHVKHCSTKLLQPIHRSGTVNFTYGYAISKCAAVILSGWDGTKIIMPVMFTRWHYHLNKLSGGLIKSIVDRIWDNSLMAHLFHVILWLEGLVRLFHSPLAQPSDQMAMQGNCQYPLKNSENFSGLRKPVKILTDHVNPQCIKIYQALWASEESLTTMWTCTGWKQKQRWSRGEIFLQNNFLLSFCSVRNAQGTKPPLNHGAP